LPEPQQNDAAPQDLFLMPQKFLHLCRFPNVKSADKTSKNVQQCKLRSSADYFLFYLFLVSLKTLQVGILRPFAIGLNQKYLIFLYHEEA
jgi:hypothetical protein